MFSPGFGNAESIDWLFLNSNGTVSVYLPKWRTVPRPKMPSTKMEYYARGRFMRIKFLGRYLRGASAQLHGNNCGYRGIDPN